MTLVLGRAPKRQREDPGLSSPPPKSPKPPHDELAGSRNPLSMNNGGGRGPVCALPAQQPTLSPVMVQGADHLVDGTQQWTQGMLTRVPGSQFSAPSPASLPRRVPPPFIQQPPPPTVAPSYSQPASPAAVYMEMAERERQQQLQQMEARMYHERAQQYMGMAAMALQQQQQNGSVQSGHPWPHNRFYPYY